eukprot:364866-Chlamydomonas_euryale.AAC.6
MHSYASPYAPMRSHEQPPAPTHSHAFRCTPMRPRTLPCVPMRYHASPRAPMRSDALPRSIQPALAAASACRSRWCAAAGATSGAAVVLHRVPPASATHAKNGGGGGGCIRASNGIILQRGNSAECQDLLGALLVDGTAMHGHDLSVDDLSLQATVVVPSLPRGPQWPSQPPRAMRRCTAAATGIT